MFAFSLSCPQAFCVPYENYILSGHTFGSTSLGLGAYMSSRGWPMGFLVTSADFLSIHPFGQLLPIVLIVWGRSLASLLVDSFWMASGRDDTINTYVYTRWHSIYLRSEIFGASRAPWGGPFVAPGVLGRVWAVSRRPFRASNSPRLIFSAGGFETGGFWTPSQHQNGQQGLPRSSLWPSLGVLGCLWGYKICCIGPSNPTKTIKESFRPSREPTDAPKSKEAQPKRYGLRKYFFKLKTTICPAGQDKLKPKSTNV